ncbi:MAG: agmatinase [Spartobacteria bacterium]|nr:agmatinase [Spartobacteria bacterium]
MTTLNTDCPDVYPAFLASEIPGLPEEECLFHVIPVPFEASVSYGKGTAGGPLAILQASSQLEAFDGISEPCQAGIYTYPPVPCQGAIEDVLDAIETAVSGPVINGKVPVTLGGEHTVTIGALRAFFAETASIGVIQFDAHADLRHTYEGNLWSHACVMRRAVDAGFRLAQFGVRALSSEEQAFRLEQGVHYVDPDKLAYGRRPELLLPPDFPDRVYVTIDVDALDPSVMPTTGTPEPGGLDWFTLMDLLARIAKDRQVVGFDVVELAPVAGQHAPDFTAARLIYQFMGMIARGRA